VSRPNVFGATPWDMEMERFKLRRRTVGKHAGAEALGASVYELDPGSPGFGLHAHYGMEELFVVLEGRPTLRTGDGEEQLAPGDVVSCLSGLRGLHTFKNDTDEPARILAISNSAVPAMAIYPEWGKVGIATRDPFETPEGDDPGFVGFFDIPEER
jgi:uncharacterized cupin superfamily protein